MEKSGFFNSNSGDRVYNADDFAAYFGDLVSNGIFYRNADNLKVTAAMGMNVTVQPGTAWINGYHYSVIIRWSNVARSINLAVINGTPAPTPTPPSVTRNADIWELGMLYVTIHETDNTDIGSDAKGHADWLKTPDTTDLRLAVNDVRNYYGMSAYVWEMDISPGTTLVAYWPFHILELRAALEAVINFVNNFDAEKEIVALNWIAISAGRPRATVMNQLMELVLQL